MGNLSVHSWADPVSGIDSVNVIKKNRRINVESAGKRIVEVKQ